MLDKTRVVWYTIVRKKEVSSMTYSMEYFEIMSDALDDLREAEEKEERE